LFSASIRAPISSMFFMSMVEVRSLFLISWARSMADVSLDVISLMMKKTMTRIRPRIITETVITV